MPTHMEGMFWNEWISPRSQFQSFLVMHMKQYRSSNIFQSKLRVSVSRSWIQEAKGVIMGAKHTTPHNCSLKPYPKCMRCFMYSVLNWTHYSLTDWNQWICHSLGQLTDDHCKSCAAWLTSYKCRNDPLQTSQGEMICPLGRGMLGTRHIQLNVQVDPPSDPDD